MLICSFVKNRFPAFYIAWCLSVFRAGLCWAGTEILQKEDEIKYVLSRDAIPAIKQPEFVSADQAALDDNEPVIGMTINGESRAYSVYLLNHHEIVNDRIGEMAFAVTWCPLANLAVAYDREIDGKEYTFGVSGKLLKNTLVMFDYETDSLWPIVYGESVEGKLTGKKLKNVTGCQKVPWGVWKRLHPDTLALSYKGSSTIGYDVYEGYHKSRNTGIFPVLHRDARVGIKANVIGIEINNRHKAYPFSLFDKKTIIVDEFEGIHLLVYRNSDTGISKVYDRQVDGVIIDFEKSMDDSMDCVTKTTWDMGNGIGVNGSMKGKTLRPVNFLAVYWFVWADYFPDTEVFPGK